MDLGHIAELHQSVRRQDFVRRRISEPRKAAAWNFKRQQPLIPVGDKSLRFGMHFRSQLLGSLHVVKRQHIRVRARRSLFEAPVRHAQEAIHSFDYLAKGAWIESDENLACLGNGLRRESHLMLRRAFQPSVKHHALLAPVGNHLDFPHYYVRAVRSAFHSRAQG